MVAHRFCHIREEVAVRIAESPHDENVWAAAGNDLGVELVDLFFPFGRVAGAAYRGNKFQFDLRVRFVILFQRFIQGVMHAFLCVKGFQVDRQRDRFGRFLRLAFCRSAARLWGGLRPHTFAACGQKERQYSGPEPF